MVVVVDIGNTNVHCGVYLGERLYSQFVHPRRKPATEKQIRSRLKKTNIDGVAIASVVPSCTHQVARFFRRVTSVKPFIVTTKCRQPLRLHYSTPRTLGVDRLANAVGAWSRYHTNVIVVGMGTAITIDVVLRGGIYCGGVIAPGMETALRSLVTLTAQLPDVSIKKPPRVVGKNTVECIQSGIVNGTIAMLKGLIKDIQHEYGRKFFVVATGGGGRFTAKRLPVHYDPMLTLFGILKLYYYNTNGGSNA